jgi:catechol 2,3-dioxygenase-like lactoylglutathione lyase family enzyme
LSMIQKVFAICLLVEKLEASLAFYRDMLGMKVNSEDNGFAEFKLGETPLALYERKQATAMFPERFMSAAGGVVIALQVENVDKTCDDLRSKGIKLFEEPKVTTWGQTVAYLHDPDGYIIELTS